MSLIEKSVVVRAPLSTVYDLWTRFEEFPRFMQGVESVRVLDERRLAWTARIGGKTLEWTAEVRERVPGRSIAWASTSGAKNHGRVRFEALEGGATQVKLDVTIEPAGVMESMGEAFGIVAHRVEGDLERFKAYAEGPGAATPARQPATEERFVERYQGRSEERPASLPPPPAPFF